MEYFSNISFIGLNNLPKIKSKIDSLSELRDSNMYPFFLNLNLKIDG